MPARKLNLRRPGARNSRRPWLKKMVTLRRIDAVKRVDGYEVLVIDGLEVQ